MNYKIFSLMVEMSLVIPNGITFFSADCIASWDARAQPAMRILAEVFFLEAYVDALAEVWSDAIAHSILMRRKSFGWIFAGVEASTLHSRAHS